MEKTLSILGAVCFVLGFAMATGVDQNPVQVVGALALMVGACVSFNAAERAKARDAKRMSITKRGKAYQDAA